MKIRHINCNLIILHVLWVEVQKFIPTEYMRLARIYVILFYVVIDTIWQVSKRHE